MLIAQITEAVPTVFRWGRIQENGDWLLPIVVLLLLAVYFVHRYRIDAAELKRWQRSLLLFLRLAALLALFLFYLQPQWEHLVGNSRVAVLIDTSASMAHRDLMPTGDDISLLLLENEEKKPDESTDSPDMSNPSNSSVGPSRLEGVLDWIQRSELIDRLLEKHDVVVYSFDKVVQRLMQQQREWEISEPEDSEDRLSGRLDDLRAEGSETCLGEALSNVLQQERGQPLAGILLLTDGRQNSGQKPDVPLETARRLRIPVYSVGVGQTRQPLNFRIGNIDLPERAFPDDPFIVKVPVEMNGGDHNNDDSDEHSNGTPEKWTIPIELWTQSLEENSPETKIDEKDVQFGKQAKTGNNIDVEFELRFPNPGKQRIIAKILPPQEDQIEEDNRGQTGIEVVDRKDRILLFASGPTRDYQFICSQINRDKSMSVDVYLPWAKPGTSQSADKILSSFPTERAEMSQYDVVVAFDPNWRDLSDKQIEELEHWVSRMGGGLILVAGPINQGDAVTGWVTDMNMDRIRAMYPVEFLARKSSFDHRYHGGEQAWPLNFSRAGEEAEFLRPKDNAAEARLFWTEFSGFYGFFAVAGVKPTATLYASSGSPESMGRDETGALIVEQFYGAGRVLYLGSGELWRLRRVDEKAFEQLVTRLVRHVGQGRLQRESDLATLTTDRRHYSLGAIAQIRITANDVQLRPLMLPKLPVDVLSPSGTLKTVEATLDANSPGVYLVHLPLTEEGNWTVQLALPENDQTISRSFQVQMSDLERENPSRNEALLRQIASQTSGVYFDNPTKALPLAKESALFGNLNLFTTGNAEEIDSNVQPITELLKIRSLRAVPDQSAEEKTLFWLLTAICSLLMLEWTLRRLMKLA